jgi:hypothetical protein
MSDEEFVIRFVAQVAKVQTLTDGGLRFTLDVSENEIEAARKLMQVKQGGGLLEVGAVAIMPKNRNESGQAETGKVGKGKHLQGIKAA